MRARRALIARASRAGKRLGYGCFLLAMALFLVGALTRFSSALATAVVTALVVGSVALAPAIVFGYGVKAAEREEREERAARSLRRDGHPSDRPTGPAGSESPQ